MILQQLIKSLIHYNHWANQQLNTFLRPIPADILTKPFTYGFGSIENTLLHMAEAQEFWIGVITESALIQNPAKADTADSMNAIQLLLNGSEKMKTLFEQYSDGDLKKHIASSDMTQSRFHFIMHVVNHNSYHRGQIIIMCKQSGATNDVPNTDYEAWLWHCR